MKKFTLKTSSWFTPLPDGYKRIGISRGSPRGFPAGYRKVKQLAPGPWFKTASTHNYKDLYFREILAALNPQEMVSHLIKISEGLIPVMVCYEAPDDDLWCHRGFVSAWLKDQLDIDVPELGFEQLGVGWNHPKLPAQFRKPSVIDRSEEIRPFIKKCFKRMGVAHQVISVDPVNRDHAIVTTGDKQFPVHIDTLKNYF